MYYVVACEKHFVYVLMCVPFISPFLWGNFCVRGRSAPETSSGHCWVTCRQKAQVGETHEWKTTRLQKETKTDFLLCSYWHTLFLLRILTLLRNPVICKQKHLLHYGAECVQNVKRERSVGSLQEFATLFPCTQKVTYFLAWDLPPWQAAFLQFMCFL